MSVLFIEYPKCTTCQKAKKWLEENGVAYEDRHIVENNPTAEELRRWRDLGGLQLKQFFNTSGMLYKSMHLKDRLPALSVQGQFDLLATDGMLVKRPIVVGDGFVLTGFKPEKWAQALL